MTLTSARRVQGSGPTKPAPRTTAAHALDPQVAPSIPDLVANLTSFASTLSTSLSRAHASLTADLADARAQLESIDADLAEAHSSLATAASERTQLVAKVDEVQAQLKSVQDALQAANQERDNLAKDMDQAKEQHKKEMDVLQQARDAFAELVSNATDELAAKETQVDELQEAIESAADRLAAYEQAEAQWETIKQALGEQVSALEAQVDDRAAELDVMREEGERMKELVSERDVQIQEYESTLLVLEEEGKEMRTKVEGLESENNKLKSTLAATESDLATARVSLKDAESRCLQLESTLQEKEAYIRNANHEIETLAQAREDMEGELIRVTEAVNDLEVERSRLQARVADLQKIGASHLETVELLSNQVDEERGKKERVEDELRVATDKLKKVQADLDATKQVALTNSSLADQPMSALLAARDSHIASLQAELESIKRKNTPFLVPKTKGPSSVMSTSSQLYSTMERLGIKRKANAMAAGDAVGESVVGARDSALGASAGCFRTRDVHGTSGNSGATAAPTGSLPNKRLRVDMAIPSSSHQALASMMASRRSQLGVRGVSSGSNLLGPNDSASVVGRAESMIGGGGAARMSRPSSNGLRKSTVITFSGFRESLPEYHSVLKEQLVKVIEEMGGGVVLGNDEFDMAVTHVVTPVNSRTFKTLAAALCHKWLVFDVNWVHESAKMGKFIDANKYGVRYFAAPFKSKSVCVTAAFREENHLRPFRIENAIRLVETYGKGSITADPDKCDMVLTTTTDKREYQAKRLDWTSFIKLIMPDETFTPSTTE